MLQHDVDTMTRGSGRLDRQQLIERYRRIRQHTAAIFDLLAEGTYYDQPIALRHPVVFYEGHLPAFSFNTLVKRALGGPGIDAGLEQLFARGIDPDSQDSGSGAARDPGAGWPDRDEVRQFVRTADERVVDAIGHAEIERPGDPLLDGAEAVFAVLEHEVMHQETLLYMWHQLPFDRKRAPSGYSPLTAGTPPSQEWVSIPPGRATLGVDRAERFGWDNEHPHFSIDVPAFDIERHDVTNAAFLAFVEAGGYRDERWWDPGDWAWIREERGVAPSFWSFDGGWNWRGMFDVFPLPLSWPVYVTYAEASAYCRWRGARLPSESEFQRAAFGTPDGAEREHPWGNAPPSAIHGVFDFDSWDPQPAGSHPAGASAWSVEDLVGNGWEWTASPFRPFPGFRPMAAYPEYSADFFDEAHFVLKGASPATGAELLRPTFRNWFRPRYPYVYATFRCARDHQ